MQQVRSILQTTARDLGSSSWDSTYGYGLVDAFSAVKEAYTYNNSISGPLHTCSTSTYEVSNLLSGLSVTWSFPANQSLIQQNYPNTNQCYFDNSNHVWIDDTLFATVSLGGTPLKTCFKHLTSYIPFSGTYSQTPIGLNKYHYNTIPDTPFLFFDGADILINPECYIDINSPKFKNMYVSCADLSITRIDEETIRFSVPYMSNIVHTTIYATSTEGCDDFSIFVSVTKFILLPQRATISMDGSELVVTLPEQLNDSNTTNNSTNNHQWDVSILNSMTNQVVYVGKRNGPTFNINTSGWSHGFYVLNIRKGDRTIVQKISL